MKFLNRYHDFLKKSKYGKIVYQAESLLIALLVALILRQFVVATFKIPSSSMERTLMTGDFLVGTKFNWGAKIPFVNRKMPSFSEIKPGNVVIFQSPYPPYLDFIKRCIAVSGDTVQYKNKQLFINGVARNMHTEGRMVSSNFIKFRDSFGPLVVPSIGDTLKLIEGDIQGNIFFVNLLKQENPDETIKLQYRFLINGKEEKMININGGNYTPQAIGAEKGTYETANTYMDQIKELRPDDNIQLVTHVELNGKFIDEFVVDTKCYFMMGDNRDNSEDSRFWGYVSHRNVLAKPLVVLYSFSPSGYKRIGTLID